MYSRKRIFEIIQIGKETDFASRFFDYALTFVILLNLFVALFSTFEVSRQFETVLCFIEEATVALFTAEYALRLWTSDYLYPRTKRKVRCAIRFALSPTGIVDLLAFAPFYFPSFFPEGMVAFRIFRIIRILGLFRVTPYQDALNVITNVLLRKKQQLISSVVLVLILMTSASLLMYGIEHSAQPDVFKNAFSGFWWATSSLLTVGYGDIYPITTAGRIVGIFLTFLGVGMVAIPTGILSAGFIEQIQELQQEGVKPAGQKEKPQYCPHCGKKL